MNITLSLSPKVDDPGFRTHTFDQVREAYAEQIRGLADGGADLLLIETIFDTLNAKAAIAAARDVAPGPPALDLGHDRRPVGPDAERADDRGLLGLRSSTPSPLIVGVNCSLGARELRPYVAELARIAPCLVAAHPNAGLPNAFGGYDETADVTAGLLRDFAHDGFLNIAGSCCGSTPAHTAAIAAAMRGLEPRVVPPRRRRAALQRARAVRNHRGHGVRPGRRAHQRHRARPGSGG